MNRTVSFFILTVMLSVIAPSLIRAETTAYIANGGADEVIRVLADSESTLETEISGSPYGCAVTPDGLQVLVTRTGEDSVSFINTGDFSGTPSQVDVGASPRGVAVEPNGNYAYVANFEDDTITEIFVSSRTVNETIEVGKGPWGVAAHYDRDKNTPVAYVTNHDDDSVSVVDKDGETTISNVGDGPTGVAVTPAGDYVYVANTFSDTVSVIDTAENEVVDTISVGDEPWGVAVGGDGAYVFVTNSADDTVTVIRSPAHTIIGTYRVGGTPRGIAAPRNGNYAYIVHQSGGRISSIDVEEENVTEVTVDTLDDAYGIGAFIGDTPPDRPTGLEAEEKNETTIEISWIDNSDDERGFKIERSKDDEENYVQIATVVEDTTTYEDNGLSSDTVYYYRVRAYVDAADSEYSGSAEATTMAYSGSIWCFIGAVAGSD